MNIDLFSELYKPQKFLAIYLTLSTLKIKMLFLVFSSLINFREGFFNSNTSMSKTQKSSKLPSLLCILFTKFSQHYVVKVQWGFLFCMPKIPDNTCTREGGFDPPQSRRKMYRVGGEKREKWKKMGKSRQKIGKIRLTIEKRRENRRKAPNLTKNRYKRLKIVHIIICKK